MSKTISEIYAEYKIIPILREHMLRVAAVASLICDNCLEPLPKKDIVTACLLHDMGNILKFRWDALLEFLEPEGLAYWQGVQEEYLEKYGAGEHQATLKIIGELGLPKEVYDFVAGVDFSEVFKLSSKPIERRICLYADCRVDPNGIVSFRERISEGRSRYKNRENRISDEQWKTAEDIFARTEDKIFSKCKIKPEGINNETIAPIIPKLRNFVIK